MRPTTQVKGGQRLQQRIAEIRQRLEKNSGVLVGIPAAAGQYEDGTPLAVIGAVQEFGANIQHPGGTRYVVSGGKARFVSNDFVGPVAGTTGPHTIPIPERSFLRVPIRANKDLFTKIYKKQIPLVVSGQITTRQLMDQLGLRAVAVSQEAISAGIGPPNAPSTVSQKGSSKPLINNGRLWQSITHVLEGEGE